MRTDLSEPGKISTFNGIQNNVFEEGGEMTGTSITIDWNLIEGMTFFHVNQSFPTLISQLAESRNKHIAVRATSNPQSAIRNPQSANSQFDTRDNNQCSF